MQHSPVVIDDLHGDTELARDPPCAPVIDLLGGRIVDGTDQPQGGAPARPGLALTAARAVAVPHARARAQGTARLYWREPVVQDDSVVPPVVDAAYAAWEFLPCDAHAQPLAIRFEYRKCRRDTIRR